MARVLNVDEFLNENCGEVILGGKKFVVRDFPTKVQDYFREGENVDMRKAVALVLGCSESDLEGYETVALSKILRFVQEKLLGEALSSQDTA